MADQGDKAELKALIAKRWAKTMAADELPARFPLVRTMYGEEEIEAMFECILSGRLTYGPKVEEFEAEFAKALGVEYAVMVNSGSSANLLAFACLVNPMRSKRLSPGDAVLVPAVCWSTSVFPIIQLGCKPILVDVDPKTCQVDLDDMRAKAKASDAKGMVAVHVIGNSCDMKEFMGLVEELDLLLLEDTCESMGSFAVGLDDKRKALGSFGDFGTFSMYFAHHITCGEGGVVICKTKEDYELCKCLRAHGWTRHLSKESREQYEAEYANVDSRFLFVNSGFNVRPMSVQAVMATVQIKQLHEFNQNRRNIYAAITGGLRAHAAYTKQFHIVEASKGVDPAWFGVAMILEPEHHHQYSDFLAYLTKNGVENRPIISGNMARQPCFKLYGLDSDAATLTGSEHIHKGGLFIGVHNRAIEDSEIDWVVDMILKFPFEVRGIKRAAE